MLCTFDKVSVTHDAGECRKVNAIDHLGQPLTALR
jgi:hypothetical protein